MSDQLRRVREVLRELLESSLSAMPTFEAGKEAQDAWADRRAKARNDATAILASPEGEAPVAAEAAFWEPLAVTDLPPFPTMLRQMWSGGQVQQWIDDNIKPMVQERHFHWHCEADSPALASPPKAATPLVAEKSEQALQRMNDIDKQLGEEP